MTTDSHTPFTPNLVIGIAIALLGVVLILDRVGIMAAQDLLKFWPVLLILFGASVVVQAMRGGADQPRQRPMVSPGFIFFIVIARSFGSLTRKLCLTIGRVIPTVSHSWNASRPIAAVGTWPEMITIGMLSM